MSYSSSSSVRQIVAQDHYVTQLVAIISELLLVVLLTTTNVSCRPLEGTGTIYPRPTVLIWYMASYILRGNRTWVVGCVERSVEWWCYPKLCWFPRTVVYIQDLLLAQYEEHPPRGPHPPSVLRLAWAQNHTLIGSQIPHTTTNIRVPLCSCSWDQTYYCTLLRKTGLFTWLSSIITN